jgi:hypothetical protein
VGTITVPGTAEPSDVVVISGAAGVAEPGMPVTVGIGSAPVSRQETAKPSTSNTNTSAPKKMSAICAIRSRIIISSRRMPPPLLCQVATERMIHEIEDSSQ